MAKKEYYIKKYGEKLDFVIKYLSEGQTVTKISTELLIGKDVIYGIKRDYNLYTSNIYHKRAQDKIELDILLKLISSNYTIPKIAEYFKVSIVAIRKFLKDNDIRIVNGNTLYKNLNEKVISYEEEQVLIGGLLGDTYLGYPRHNHKFNSSGSFTHCLNQLEYCYYKYNLLKELCSEPTVKKCFDKRSNKNYEQIDCRILSNKSLNSYTDSFYFSGKKEVYKELLYKLDGLGLAI